MLNTFERKILQRIYGPIQKGGRWRPRWNNELYTLYNDLNIVEDIEIRRQYQRNVIASVYLLEVLIFYVLLRDIQYLVTGIAVLTSA
jgi:hypothetical protein